MFEAEAWQVPRGAPFLTVLVLAGLAGSACVSPEPVKSTAPRPEFTVGSAFVNSLGMTMVRIPSGSFLMGSRLTPEEVTVRFGGRPTPCRDEHPLHVRVIDQPFYLAGSEVTVGQFRRFVESAGYETDAEREGWAFAYVEGMARSEEGRSWRSPGFRQGDDHPVVYVSWHDVRAFCRWLSRQEGRSYRLPTEAEWEYACRAGTGSVFWWGDDMDETGRVANVADAEHLRPGAGYVVMPMDDGHAFTAPGGSYRGNAFGLFDMIGNVSEWCEDAYGPYPGGAGWVAGAADARVARGGSWYNVAYYCRCAYRYAVAPTDRYPNVGFRVAADAE